MAFGFTISLALRLVRGVFFPAGVIAAVVLVPWATLPLLALLIVVTALYKWRRYEHALPKTWSPPAIETRRLVVRDGVEICYYVVRGDGFPGGGKLMLLAPPLGQCGFSIYYPIMARYGRTYTYVTWDYRGLHSSQQPHRTRRISIPMHAEDGVEILAAVVGERPADVMVGHSMGVQVCLETVLIYPERIDSLVLLNGAHGKVFSTAFQPLFRIPLVSDVAYTLVEALLEKPHYVTNARRIMAPILAVFLPIWCRLFGSTLLKGLFGADYLNRFADEYLGGVCKTDKTLRNFLRLFQELDSHSARHLLTTIEHPTLIITGLWDVLTPAYHGSEMCRRMKNARHVNDIWSSHATLMEHPELVIHELDAFFRSRRRLCRRNSTEFERAGDSKRGRRSKETRRRKTRNDASRPGQSEYLDNGEGATGGVKGSMARRRVVKSTKLSR